jgi:signal transduction histidine kinase
MSDLKVLLVEDSEHDAVLIVRELRRAGFNPEYRRVETADEMARAMDEASWDVVLSDYAMPEFNGMDALDQVRRHNEDLPFIVVSGRIGEDVAVEAMKAGANDYIMKSNLKRLGTAVQREVREARERQERKRVEKELRLTEEELRVSRQVERLKDEFIGMVSHELKNPLTVIIGALSVAVSEGVPRAEAALLVRDALDSAASLNVIIDNLLELSRSQRSALNLSLNPCDIPEVVNTVVKKLEDKSSIHQLSTHIQDGLPLIPADALRVERILYNLVDNAVKYSPDGGPVDIKVLLKDNHLLCSVSDTGIGISGKNQQKLFRHFQRLDDQKGRQVEGVGLGLRVCKVLVEAHGGRIWLQSAPRSGTTFFFTLPLEGAVAAE